MRQGILDINIFKVLLIKADSSKKKDISYIGFFKMKEGEKMSVVKSLLNLGLGALAMTKEKAEQVVSELVKKGEIGQDEGKELINELIKKGEKSKKEIEEQIEKIVKNVTERLDISTKKEIKELKSEVEELKKKLNKEE